MKAKSGVPAILETCFLYLSFLVHIAFANAFSAFEPFDLTARMILDVFSALLCLWGLRRTIPLIAVRLTGLLKPTSNCLSPGVNSNWWHGIPDLTICLRSGDRELENVGEALYSGTLSNRQASQAAIILIAIVYFHVPVVLSPDCRRWQISMQTPISPSPLVKILTPISAVIQD